MKIHFRVQLTKTFLCIPDVTEEYAGVEKHLLYQAEMTSDLDTYGLLRNTGFYASFIHVLSSYVQNNGNCIFGAGSIIPMFRRCSPYGDGSFAVRVSKYVCAHTYEISLHSVSAYSSFAAAFGFLTSDR